MVLRAVLFTLNDTSTAVLRSSCHVLDKFCEYLEADQMREYLQPLMERLLAIAESPETQFETRVSATSALASVVLGGKEVRPPRCSVGSCCPRRLTDGSAVGGAVL